MRKFWVLKKGNIAKMKKILFIDVHYGKSSTGKIVEELHKGAIDAGLSSYVAYGRGKKRTEKNIFKFGVDLETYFHVLMTRITGFHGYFSFFSTRRLIKYIKKVKPDIIHIHELHGYFVNIPKIMKFIAKLNIKVIWTFHCEYMYTGKGYVYSLEEIPDWDRKKEYPKSLFFDQSEFLTKKYQKYFKLFTDLTITSPSLWVDKRIKESFLSYTNSLVVYNPIDTEVYKPTFKQAVLDKYDIGDKKVVLSVAPKILEPRKGGEWVLKIAKQFAEKNDTLFILVGVEGVKQITKQDNVILVPRTDSLEELLVLYTKANVFLLTSIRETFSMVSMEALACGTPVVGFEAGAPEIVFTKPYGNFVQYGDIEKLVALLDKALLTTKNVDENVNFVKEKFDKSVVLSQYLALYK